MRGRRTWEGKRERESEKVSNLIVCLSDSYSGDLSAEEMAAVEEAAKQKESAISLILEREKEINAISKGSITTSKVSEWGKMGRRARRYSRFFSCIRTSHRKFMVCAYNRVTLKVAEKNKP